MSEQESTFESKVSHELKPFFASEQLFDVQPCALDEHVSKRCAFKNPKCRAEFELYTVVGIQRDYTGKICLRIVSDNDTHKFGRCAQLDELEFVNWDLSTLNAG